MARRNPILDLGHRFDLRAKHLFRANGTFVENGLVEVRGGRLGAVGRAPRGAPPGALPSLPDAVILPGFVNGHAHLELTSLRGRVRSGKHFHLWLERVRALRAEMKMADLRASSQEGVEESLRSGTTTIVDHNYTGSSLRPFQEAGIRAHLVFEMIALRPGRVAGFRKKYRKLRDGAKGHPLLEVGVAPHAPYTASPELYRAARSWVGARQRLSTHLSEHPAESEFLGTGQGDLRWLLETRGLGVEGFVPPRQSPFEYMEALGVLRPGTLLVHCNYVRPGDIEILRRRRMPAVYCPRSHAFFGHPPHPVARLRKAGVTVGLGTDSLTSNRTLSILDEMRFLHGRRRDLSPMDLLEMATHDGARAVWGQGKIGRLARGQAADLVVVALPPGGRGRVEERLLDERSKVILTVVNGVVRYAAPALRRRARAGGR